MTDAVFRDAFNLRKFHDTLVASGRLPLSLIHWEMTGNDNGIAGLWERSLLPAGQ